jgi:hypothetical protein
MISRTIFLAQALDNISADHIMVDDEMVPTIDNVLRQDAVSKVSKVTNQSKKSIYDNKCVRLQNDMMHFVLSVRCSELDCSGRNTSIVCYGSKDRLLDVVEQEALIHQLEKFAAQIGRDLDRQIIYNVRDAFSIVKKRAFKSQKNNLVLMILSLLTILVILILLRLT